MPAGVGGAWRGDERENQEVSRNQGGKRFRKGSNHRLQSC